MVAQRQLALEALEDWLLQHLDDIERGGDQQTRQATRNLLSLLAWRTTGDADLPEIEAAVALWREQLGTAASSSARRPRVGSG